MRTKIFLALALILGMASCHTFDPMDPNELESRPAPLKTHTIEQFLDGFMTERGVLFPVRTRSGGNGLDVAGNQGLFSVDTLPSQGQDVVIYGRVVSEDVAGNIYKTLIVQDADNPKQGLRISVDAGSLSGMYPIGQLVAIRCNGLAVGKYANQSQLAVPVYNNNTNASNASQKVGWAPGRIPIPLFSKAVTIVGKLDPTKVKVDTMTIQEITSVISDQKEIRRLSGRLICIKDIFFNGSYDKFGTPTPLTENDPDDEDKNKSESSPVFAPTTHNVGHPQSRYIEDVNGNLFLVSTSEYAKFSRRRIPESKFKGTVTGIVSFYHDNARYSADATNWSITLRSLDDLELKDEKGKEWIPEYYKKP